MPIKIRLLVALLLCSLAQQALGCASCAGGGDDFLVLYPNETLKTYVGLNHQWGFRNILSNGRSGTTLGPAYKDSFIFALALRLTEEIFISAGSSVVKNTRDSESRYGMGDTFVNGRLTLLPQSIDAPLIPQVQLLGGFKMATGRSVQESTDAQLLDITGSGFNDVKAGVDLWFGMFPVKFGAAQTATYFFEKHLKMLSLQKGLGLRTMVTLAWRPENNEYWQIVGGLIRDFKDSLRINGHVIDNSKELSYSFFIASDFTLPSRTDSLRLSFARQGSIFTNINTSLSSTLSLAWLRTLD